MENALVSIIVPCYNQGEYLSEALNSLIAQSYPYWECVIMDDGSTDNSKSIALSFCEKDKRFSYFWQENQGLSMTRNNGIKRSHGEYILPLDADDKIHPNYLGLAVEILDHQKDIAIVYSRAELFGARSGEWYLPDFNMDDFMKENCIFCSAMYRRKDYNRTVGYNPNMKGGWEDWDFWLSLMENGGNVYKLPYKLFYYRIKNASMAISLNKSQEIIDSLHKTIVMNHPLMFFRHYSSLHDRYYAHRIVFHKKMYYRLNCRIGVYLDKILKFFRRG